MAGVILVPRAVERMLLLECRLHGEWPGSPQTRTSSET